MKKVKFEQSTARNDRSLDIMEANLHDVDSF